MLLRSWKRPPLPRDPLAPRGWLPPIRLTGYAGYIGKRLLAFVPLLFGISLITFFLIRLLPGDPARVLAGSTHYEEAIEAIRQRMGLDQPIPVQYGIYLRNLLQGDLGQSWFTGKPVASDLADRAPATLELITYGLLLAILIGVVLAFQGADQLRRFGAEIFTVNLLGVSVLRELGVLLTAIIIAGRSGSAFTAQIGAMEVNEEVDALRTIGLDPIEVLVLPRLLGLMLTLPLLSFFASMMALLGGGLMVVLVLDVPMVQFLRQLSTAVSTTTLWAGLVKAPVFAFLIAIVGCFEGMRVSRSAESVGQLTTTSVVLAIFLVILVDAVFSILFAQIGF